MRVLLRVLAPLVSLAVAVLGALIVVEVAAAWTGAGTGSAGLLVPWRDWRTTAGNTLWTAGPVLAVAIAAAVVGGVLLLVALLARRHDVRLTSPSPGLTVVTAPRVLARIVGRDVRAADPVTAASVTASARAVTVRASGRDDTAAQDGARTAATAVLDGLPLARRPRLTVRVAPDRARTEGVR